MQVSLKWINELVNIEFINLNQLMNQLILGGFEVEELIQVRLDKKTQIALEISATANRSDSLSVQGLSREIMTFFPTNLKISNYSLPQFHWQPILDPGVTILPNNVDCSALIAVKLENVINVQVPKWIQEKLKSSNITVTNTFLDFENYIRLETGYVFLCYDFLKICSQLESSTFQLSLSKGKESEDWMDSLGASYSLNASIGVIRANHEILSVTGISPHQDYSYSSKTTSFLIEASIFDANKVRQQSRDLGLRTHQSARFEKSLKPTYLVPALYRFLSLLRVSNPNLRCQLHTIAKTATPNWSEIVLNYDTVTEILGPIYNFSEIMEISPENINDYLKRLKFPFEYDALYSRWKVQIPELRKDDLTREIDLIEEIGRLAGFQKFVTHLPPLKRIGKEDSSYQIRKKITSCFLNFGWNEMVHSSLMKEVNFKKNQMAVINPLGSDNSYLKASLLPSLIQTTQENWKQNNRIIEGFEYGHVFLGETLRSFEETELIGGIFGGIPTKRKWSEPAESLTWLEAKGKLDQFFQQLNLPMEWKGVSDSRQNIFHPYKSAEIYTVSGKKLGIFGQLHPQLTHLLGIASDIYLFELDLALIQNQMEQNALVIYQEYSLYPRIVKDLSFLLKKDISFKTIQQFLQMNGTKFLSEIHLLDEYMGPSIPDQQKSLCLQLIFQSKEKTLEYSTIERIMQNLQSFLIESFEVTFRT